MVILELTCGHIKEINETPRVDEVCEECKAIKCVVNYWADEWHSVCPACPYHKTHGFGRKWAEKSCADHHAQTAHDCRALWYKVLPPHIRKHVRAENTSKKIARNAAIPVLPPF